MRYVFDNADASLNAVQFAQALQQINFLFNERKTADIKEVRPKRSLKQNSYLHLLLSIFGLETGYTLEEAKVVYKRVNYAKYAYQKNNATFFRSSADLDNKDMAESIDIFRAYAANNGVQLPLPNEEQALLYWQNEIERRGNYL